MPSNILQRFAVIAVCLAASGVAMAQIQRGAPVQAEQRSPAADIERGSIPFVGDDWSFPDLVERLPFGSSYDSVSKSDGDIISSCAIGPATYNDTWYRWVAPSDGEATLGAFSGNVGPGLIVAVYKSSCQFEPIPEFTEVACDSIIPVAGERGFTEISATWSARQGTTYLLQVGFPTDPPPAPTTGTNDVNTWLTFQGVAGGEDCETAADVGATPFTVRSNTFDFAADGPPGSCNDPGATVMEADAWWSWTAPADGDAQLYANSNGDAVIAAVYDGTCDALNEIDCASQVFLPQRGGATATINFAAVAGTTYYIQVGLPEVTPPSAQRGGPTIDVWLTAELAPGDDCAAAVTIPDSPFLTQYDPTPLLDGTSDTACHAGTLLNDGWYQWTAPADGELSLAAEIVGPSFGTLLLNVFSGGCETLEPEFCSLTRFLTRDVPVTPVTIPVEEGITYYVQLGFPLTEVMTRGNPPPIYFDLTFGIPCPEGTFAKLMADDARTNDLFGNEVDVQENLAIVVRAGEDENGASAGATYVYEYDPETEQWLQITKLLASDGATKDIFGTAIALNGPYIAVGAPDKFGSSTGEGAVYIFERDDVDPTLFNEIKKIVSPTPMQNEKFGYAVDFLGTTLVVGNRFGPGTVYVFEQNEGGADNFGLVQTITSDATGRFGWDLDLNGDLLIAGAPGDNVTLAGDGSAYVYRLEEVLAPRGPVVEEYVLVEKIENPDPEPFARFGKAVAIDADSGHAVVGADEDRRIANLAGRAFVFEQNLGGTDNWGFAAALAPSELMPADNFGLDVAILGDVAYVGCPLADLVSPAPAPRGEPAPEVVENVGAVYVFTRDTDGPGAWGQVAKMHALDADPGDLYGNAVGVDLTGQLIIGAEADDEAIGNAGAAYVGPGGYADCNLNGILDICDILDGTSEDEDGDLVPDECFLEVCRGFALFQLERFPEESYAAHGFSTSIRGLDAIVGAPFADAETDNPVDAGNIVPEAGVATVYQLLPFIFLAGDMDSIPFEWYRAAELISPYPQPDDLFGFDVDMEDGFAAVGAPFGEAIPDRRTFFGAGAAFVYRRPTFFDYFFGPNTGPPFDTGWPVVGALYAQDGQIQDLFGFAVDIESSYALVGAPGADSLPEGPVTGEEGEGIGAVYAFESFQLVVPFPPFLFSEYGQVQKIQLDPDGQDNAFGGALDIDDSTAAIGAPGYALELKLFGLGGGPRGITGGPAGAAYIYERLELLRGDEFPTDFEWVQIAELIPSMTHELDAYGLSVAVEGDFAAVGAPLFGDPVMMSPETGLDAPPGGAVFVFHRDAGGEDNWGQVAMLQAFDAEIEDLFGYSVSISGDFLIVGAPGDDLSEEDLPFPRGSGSTGSIYVFQMGDDPGEWLTKGKLIADTLDLTTGSPVETESLGQSVDMDGSIVIGGAPDTDIDDSFTNEYIFDDAGLAYAFHAIADCQPNDVLDLCDLLFGDSEDENPADLVPDECQGTGACCVGDFLPFTFFAETGSFFEEFPPCVDGVSEAQCDILRGTYLGDDTICAGSTCVGACCPFGFSSAETGPGFDATVGYVDFDGNEVRLTSYTNPSYTFSGAGLGTDAGQVSANGTSTEHALFACWPMERAGLSPNGVGMALAIADDSAEPATGNSLDEADVQGFAGRNKTDGFFGVTNTGGEVVVEFTFDISGFAVTEVSIDLAAMGNFENGDTDPILDRGEAADDLFLFEYSIDGAPFETLFNPRADEGPDGGPRPTQNYYMDNAANNPVTLEDPLVLNSTKLSDNFYDFYFSLPMAETGTSLTIRATFNADGTSEGFGFDNLRIVGQPQGSCVEMIEPECAFFGGSFQGPGTTCEETTCDGACCLGIFAGQRGIGGECIETDIETCFTMDGVFLGSGTTCADAPCGDGPGACCLGFTNTGDRVQACENVDRETCETDLMGVFVGSGTDCLTTECSSLGACCWSCPPINGSPTTDATQCVDALSLDDCCLIDGLWAGPMTACAAMPCSGETAQVCRGDLDGNNRVNVFDFGIFALDFGCGTASEERMKCVADLNCDGTVDVFDFGIFALNFGCIGPEPTFTQCGNPNKPPTGACCVPIAGRGVAPDETCVIATESDCIASGGTYQGDGTDCASVTCGGTVATGACCDGASCTIETESNCGALGGAYLGDGTDCSEDPCAPPTGACCIVGAACFETDENDCTNSGGMYQGDGTDCIATPCPEETGACCLGAPNRGGCTETTESECNGMSGFFIGPGTGCSPDPCLIR